MLGTSETARHKVREEIETELTDGATMQRIFLRGWGCGVGFRYEKYRTDVCAAGGVMLGRRVC